MTRSRPFGWQPRSVPSLHPFTLSGTVICFEARPFRLIHATGRPYTLIFNGSVTSSGAVGIALSAGRRPTLRTKFLGLRAITTSLTVTRYVYVCV